MSDPLHEMETRLAKVSVRPDLPISAAMAQLDRAETGVLLLTDPERRLAGLITDGDIRRAVLAGVPLSEPCSRIASSDPVVAPPLVTPDAALALMDRGREFPVDHLPLVSDDRRLHGLLLRRDFVPETTLALSAVIMAGGYGTRLLPLTEQTPKPMLLVGDRPLMELTIERLKAAGIRRVNVTAHYLADRIEGHFGDGRRFGVELNYVTEARPLGTAGSLRQLSGGDDPLLVINGDILTDIHFREMLTFHREQRADITVAVRRYEMQVPYGVVECERERIVSFQEKPVHRFFVNAGIYILEPAVLRTIPEAERLDMPELIDTVLRDGGTVVSFPVVEYWLDVGRPADYEQAQTDMRDGVVAH